MNAAAAHALYEAERTGVRQIRGSGMDARGGRCAMTVIVEAMQQKAVVAKRVEACPLCGGTSWRPCKGHVCLVLRHEGNLVVHLNDDHGLTFAEIARKLGPDSA